MKGVTSLEVDRANYYLVYPKKQNSWSTNGKEAKATVLTSFGNETGLFMKNSEKQLPLPGTCEAKGGLGEEKPGSLFLLGEITRNYFS